MTAKKLIFLLAVVGLTIPSATSAGPPYVTDDPEPVEYQHWEFYGASQNALTSSGATGTLPHVEINYGVQPGMQLHVLAPWQYNYFRHGAMYFGVGDIELGAKLRFVTETNYVPTIGVFPLYEAPAGDARRGLGAGHPSAFFPLWIQKSIGPWTTYGGGGYWFNPGRGNRNWVQAGWLVQRQIGKYISPGAEVFYESPQVGRGPDDWRFNVGFTLDFTEHHHLLFSVGRSVVRGVLLQNYTGCQFTI